MKKREVITQCLLFAGMEEEQRERLLACLGAVSHSYPKNAFIFMAGDKASSVGIVLSGSVRVLQEDFWGRRMILAHIGPGGLFGEAFACAGKTVLPVSVAAAEEAEIMRIDYRKIITTCSSACVFHSTLIMNMMRILAGKNILLAQKMEHLSKRTTRDKLLSFLSAQALQTGGNVVKIPFNRQELADYLCVDRSALSRELGMMREEGVITCKKNLFVLKQEGQRPSSDP